MEDQENRSSEVAATGSHPPWPDQWTGQQWRLEERALQELRMVDPTSEEEEEDDDQSISDFESEGLHEILERRIQQNADGRYDFEIYVDPANR